MEALLGQPVGQGKNSILLRQMAEQLAVEVDVKKTLRTQQHTHGQATLFASGYPVDYSTS